MGRLFAFCLILLPGIALAQTPAPGSYSGTFSNGSSVTITGTSFGSTGPTVAVFDNFESGSDGVQISTTATTSTWSSVGTGQTPRYSTEQFVSGSKSMRVRTNDADATSGVGLGKTFSAPDVYASFWLKVPTGDTCPGNGGPDMACNWKMTWLYQVDTTVNDIAAPSSAQFPGTPWANNWQMFGNGNLMSDDSSAYFDSCTMHYPACVAHDWDFNTGNWYRIQLYFHSSPVDGSAANQMWISSADAAMNNQSVYNSDHGNVRSAGNFGEWDINGYTRQTITGTTRLYWDDVYIATSPSTGCARARVDVADNATYTSARNITMVQVTSWSDTSIVGTVRSGPFGSSASGYLFVTQCNGNRNATGMAVTFGASGGSGGGGSRRPNVVSGDRFNFASIPMVIAPIAFIIHRRRKVK